MVVAHSKFEFQKKCLIEKIIIKAPFRFTADFHNEACFIYFSEGKTKINSQGEQYLIKSGESVLLKCGKYFADLEQFGTGDNYEILVFHLHQEVLREIYRDELPTQAKQAKNNLFINPVASNDVVSKFIESLHFYFDNPALVSEELLKLKIKELILFLLRTEYASSIVSLLTDLFTPRNLGIREIVDNHLFSDLAIDDLAGLCNLSVSTFNRSFQTIFNDTPAYYIRLKRLERAKELLTLSSLTISEIAFQTCFNDVAHFSRSFKTVYHISPSQYRSSKQ